MIELFGSGRTLTYMSSAAPRSGLICMGLAVLCLAGCQGAKQSSVPAIVSQAEADGLLRQVPAELRWDEPAEDPAAQERYIKCLRTVQGDSFNGHRSYSEGGSGYHSAKAEKLRQILKSGPVQVGFDEAMAIDSTFYAPVSPSLVSGLLFDSAIAAIQAKDTARAVEDIKLAFDWMLQTSDPGSLDAARPFDSYNFMSRISQASQLDMANRKKILAVLPSEEKLKELQKDQIKQLLEAKIYSLAGLSEPKKDLVLGRMSRNGAFIAATSANPKNTIFVPPHGTLDKEATLNALIEMARLTILTLDSGADNRMGLQKQVSTDFVKWLPTLPPYLTTNTKAERDYVQKKVDFYVEEMNKGENTLGRQFLQSWQSVPMDFRSSIGQFVADFKRSLESAPMAPKIR
jgi:hypothetical protein